MLLTSHDVWTLCKMSPILVVLVSHRAVIQKNMKCEANFVQAPLEHTSYEKTLFLPFLYSPVPDPTAQFKYREIQMTNCVCRCKQKPDIIYF